MVPHRGEPLVLADLGGDGLAHGQTTPLHPALVDDEPLQRNLGVVDGNSDVIVEKDALIANLTAGLAVEGCTL